MQNSCVECLPIYKKSAHELTGDVNSKKGYFGRKTKFYREYENFGGNREKFSHSYQEMWLNFDNNRLCYTTEKSLTRRDEVKFRKV